MLCNWKMRILSKIIRKYLQDILGKKIRYRMMYAVFLI